MCFQYILYDNLILLKHYKKRKKERKIKKKQKKLYIRIFCRKIYNMEFYKNKFKRCMRVRMITCAS